MIGEPGEGAWEQDEVGDSRVIALVITGSGPDMARLEAHELLARYTDRSFDGIVRIGVVIKRDMPNLLTAPFSLSCAVAPCKRKECACPISSYEIAVYRRVRPQPRLGDEHAEVYIVPNRRFFEHFCRIVRYGV